MRRFCCALNAGVALFNVVAYTKNGDFLTLAGGCGCFAIAVYFGFMSQKALIVYQYDTPCKGNCNGN